MARLPVPGQDNGTWGDILNDFLNTEHTNDGTLKLRSDGTFIPTNTVTAKGDLLVGSAAAAVTQLPVGSNGQVLTSDSSQTGGMRWSTPASAPSTPNSAYPLSAYGFHSVTADLNAFTGAASIGDAWFVRVFVPAGNAINAIATVVRAAGTLGVGGLNSFAIYSDTGTLLASTANDDTQWQTTGWLVKTLASPIPASGSDRFVYAAISNRGYASLPSIAYNTTQPALTDGGGYLVNNRRAFYAGISTWPGSINPATYGNSGDGYMPLIALG